MNKMGACLDAHGTVAVFDDNCPQMIPTKKQNSFGWLIRRKHPLTRKCTNNSWDLAQSIMHKMPVFNELIPHCRLVPHITHQDHHSNNNSNSNNGMDRVMVVITAFKLFLQDGLAGLGRLYQ